MTPTIIPEADIRRELRKMLEKQKSEFLEEWATMVTEFKDKASKQVAEAEEQGPPELAAKMRMKYAEGIDKMEAKPAEVEGIYEQFLAFVDNAQFPDSAA